MKTPLLALALALVLALDAGGEARAFDLAGAWSGVWTRNGDALPVTVTFARAGEGWKGAFDSDALQVSGIPFAEVTDVEDRVRWRLQGDQTTTAFDGVLSGDTLTGAFAEGDVKGAFTLARVRLPAPIIDARDVAFVDGDVRLAGTLLLPSTPGPHPAIVFLHGSGPEGRWANRYLAGKFAEAGFVALIYDKRGVGQSTGDWRSAGLETLADDAAAGVRFLRAQAGVDPAHVGVYGHSQGGLIAPVVAARDPGLAFVVASAAGGVSPAEMERFSLMNAVGADSLSAGEREAATSYVDAVVGVAYRGAPRAPLDALAAGYAKRAWYFPPPAEGDSYWTISRLIAPFDPVVWWRQVRCPVLLIYAGHDERVPSDASAVSITAALRSGGASRVAIQSYPHADHTFTIVNGARPGGWPAHEPDYAATVIAWTGRAISR